MADPSPSAPVIRLARGADVPGLVRVFDEVMPESVWPQMGKEVAGEFMRHYVESPLELMILATLDNEVVGFVMGTLRPDTVARGMYSERLFEMLAALGKTALDDPSVLGIVGDRVWSGVKGAIRRRLEPKPDFERLDADIPRHPQNACFMSLYVVSPKARGRRIATSLSQRFIEEVEARGFEWSKGYCTVDNVASQIAQERAGFRPAFREGEYLTHYRKLEPMRGAKDPALLTVAGVEDRQELEVTPETSGFLAPGWVLRWWDEHEREGARLRAAVVRDEGRVIAIVPTALREGVLRFMAAECSNYCGPVYEPRLLRSFVPRWIEHLGADREIESIDLTGLRERSPFFMRLASQSNEGLGRPHYVATNTCPELDLRPGWKAVLHRHKSKQRATWRKKWRRLERFGELEFVETSDPTEIEEAMPEMFELYAARWNVNVHRAFRGEVLETQLAAARELGPRGAVLLSMLRLEGKVIAYAYGLRGGGVTSSYTLAHDADLAPFSPGLLLLLRMLEAAAKRGDPRYDFSLGTAAYKAMWETDRQQVFSALWGPIARRTVLGRRLWGAARSVPLLRELKQQGVRALVPLVTKRAPESLPTPAPTWHVHKIDEGGGEAEALEPLGYAAAREQLEPDMIERAVERQFRGDTLLSLTGEGDRRLGVIWQACERRIPLVTGELDIGELGEVYYHPLRDHHLDGGLDHATLVRRLAPLGPLILVSREPIRTPGAASLGSFRGEF